MKKLFLLFFVLHFVSYGQKNTGLEICVEIQKNSKGFLNYSDADDVLSQILSTIGASKNFYLIPCDEINNALALTYKGERFILYDKDFIDRINKATNDWSGKFILAHEVGHHINGHTRDFLIASVLDDQTKEKQREEELEADEFAGFIVAKLGAKYNQIKELINTIAPEKDDKYSTHPNRSKRLEAIRRGFNKVGVNTNQVSSNYSIVKESSSGISKWGKTSIKEKDALLKKINDPFERLEIINNDEIPDKKITSWVYGRVVNDTKNKGFKRPKLVVEQEIFSSKGSPHDYYDNTTINLFESFFYQKVQSLITPLMSNKDKSNLNDYLKSGDFKFEFVFDDGYKGEFISTSLGDKPWMIMLDLKLSDEYKRCRGEFRDCSYIRAMAINEYKNFIKKLMTQKKIFIRLVDIDPNFLIKTVTGKVYNVLKNNYNSFLKTEEFDLMGSSKALKLD